MLVAKRVGSRNMFAHYFDRILFVCCYCLFLFCFVFLFSFLFSYLIFFPGLPSPFLIQGREQTLQNVRTSVVASTFFLTKKDFIRVRRPHSARLSNDEGLGEEDDIVTSRSIPLSIPEPVTPSSLKVIVEGHRFDRQGVVMPIIWDGVVISQQEEIGLRLFDLLQLARTARETFRLLTVPSINDEIDVANMERGTMVRGRKNSIRESAKAHSRDTLLEQDINEILSASLSDTLSALVDRELRTLALESTSFEYLHRRYLCFLKCLPTQDLLFIFMENPEVNFHIKTHPVFFL